MTAATQAFWMALAYLIVLGVSLALMIGIVKIGMILTGVE